VRLENPAVAMRPTYQSGCDPPSAPNLSSPSGRDDKKTGIAGGARIGGIGIGGIGRRQSKAIVGIDARIVDIQTAEILGVAAGFGESKRSGTTLIGGAAVGSVAAGGAFNMGTSNFQSTILGEATRLAVDSLTTELVGAAGRIKETVVSVSGRRPWGL
jgi:curli biogenesis system outer membrane secretion channel CsgG